MIECNAIIKSVSIETERGLSAWLYLDYGDCSQAFGGFLLYAQKSWDENTEHNRNYAGHFIKRCIDVGGVEKWEKLPGKTIRVRREDGLNGRIIAIGHIVKDDWFDPRKDFEEYDQRTK